MAVSDRLRRHLTGWGLVLATVGGLVWLAAAVWAAPPVLDGDIEWVYCPSPAGTTNEACTGPGSDVSGTATVTLSVRHQYVGGPPYGAGISWVWSTTGYDGVAVGEAGYRVDWCLVTYDPEQAAPVDRVLVMFTTHEAASRTAPYDRWLGWEDDFEEPLDDGWPVYAYVQTVGSGEDECTEANDPVWDENDPPTTTTTSTTMPTTTTTIAPALTIVDPEPWQPGFTGGLRAVGLTAGWDISCVGQGSGVYAPAESPAAGTVGEDGTFGFGFTWDYDGVYSITCTGDDFSQLTNQVTVGSGLDEIVPEGDCGWFLNPLNIGCYMKKALVWAFIPDGDALYEMWDQAETATETAWPLGPLVSAVGVVGDVMVDFGRGAENPGYYGLESQQCHPLGEAQPSEACEYGIMLGQAFSDDGTYSGGVGGATPLFGEIDLASDDVMGGLGEAISFPATRLFGESDDETMGAWAGRIRGFFRILMLAAAVRLVIGIASWAMGRHPPGEQLQFKF
jgi:hypothetical protein